MHRIVRNTLVLASAIASLAATAFPARAAELAFSGFGLGGRYAFVNNQDTDESSHMLGVLARARGKFIGLEAAVDYRNEEFGNDIDLKTWPATASLLILPIAPVYALVGLGLYNTTIDFPEDFAFDDETESKLGYHFGAGAEILLNDAVSVTGDVRWHFVDYEFENIPSSVGEVDADVMTVNLGLVFYFR
ncbi:MAG: outer membrane beta-barrel protein [bacterium]